MLARQKKAADGFLAGKTKVQAMKDAGYSDTTSETKHSDVFGHPAVADYIEKKQRLSAQKSNVTLDWITEQLKSIASANLGDMVVIDLDGSMSIDYTKLTPDLRKALSGFVIDEIKEGRGPNARTIKRIKVQTSDKLRALDMLVRHLGLSQEKLTIDVEGDLVERLTRARRRSGVDS